MGSPILGFSDLPIIGENRCCRKWAKNSTFEPNQGFKITFNREMSTKLIQKNSLPSSAQESQFRDKQKFHSAPKQRHPVSNEGLSNWPFVLWLQRTASSAWLFTALNRERSTSWYEIMHFSKLGNLPIIGESPLQTVHLGYSRNVFPVETYKYRYPVWNAASVSEGIVASFFKEEIYNLYYYKHQKTL